MSKGTSSIRSCTRLVGVFILPLCRLTLSRHRLHPENPGLSSRKCHGTCTNIPQTDSTLQCKLRMPEGNHRVKNILTGGRIPGHEQPHRSCNGHCQLPPMARCQTLVPEPSRAWFPAWFAAVRNDRATFRGDWPTLLPVRRPFLASK